MGNKLGKRRQVVDEKYTRPQGLYVHQDVDHKKLKKLILGSKLAPCYPGDDDCGSDLEECPICFMCYPSLNRSRCCMKGICTECFLQMKTPNSTRPAQCPFCKTSNYAVEFRGVKTKEEKGLEQIEEQRVIEAKIRMWQKEIQDDDERILKQRETSSFSSMRRPNEADYCSTTDPSLASAIESEEIVASHETSTASAIRLSPHQRLNREDTFDLDLEDLMVMEAIWLSIQENGRRREAPFADAAQSEQFTVEKRCSIAGSSSSSSGGLACAIAALAERQQMSGETCNNYNEDISTFNTPACSRSSSREVHESETYFLAQNASVALPDSTHLGVMGDDRQWVDSRPLALVAEVGSSIIPESFEEQMMLAMAVSLAEA